jgi:hypothetical protein
MRTCKVYDANGNVLAETMKEAAAQFKTSRMTMHTITKPRNGGGREVWRLPISSTSGRPPSTRIVLPNGEQVTGWPAATAATGTARPALLARATWRDGAWYVRDRKRPGRYQNREEVEEVVDA